MQSRAFTLIELLVVVLIIGILSAIALPQYQRAVEKSRATEAFVALRNIQNAMEICKMENGSVCQDVSSLAIELPGTKINDTTWKMNYFTVDIRNFGSRSVRYEIVATRNANGTDSLKYYIYNSYNRSILCVATHEKAKAHCANLCGKAPYTRGNGYSCTIPL